MNRLVATTLALLVALPAPLMIRAAHADGYRERATRARAAQIKTQLAGAATAARNFGTGVKEFVKVPAGHITVGALVLGLSGVLGSTFYEKDRGKLIPLAFSEISQIERDARNAGVPVDPFTHYLAKLNDSVMKVFEAHNLANTKLRLGGYTERLQAQLKNKLELQLHHYELPGLLGELPGLAREMRGGLGTINATSTALRPIAGNFRASWDDSHVDHYKMVLKTKFRTVTGADGKSHTETYTEWESEYDYTQHTYRYNKPQGEAASANLDVLRAKQPTITIPAILRTASKTGADNESAIRRSRRVDEHMKADELLSIANTWAAGSTYAQNIATIESLWNKTLVADGANWRRDKATSRYQSYRTYSRSDSGPAEFQTAQTALSNSEDFIHRVDEILNGLAYTEANAPQILAKIRQFVATDLQKIGTRDARRLAGEIIDMSRQMYSLNFKAGVDTHQFRTWLVMVWLLTGAMAGGALGAGVRPALDYLKGRRNGGEG